MSKLIVHLITDEMESKAKVFYKGNIMECESETVLNFVDILLGLEILDVDDVVIVKEDEIYEKLANLLEVEDAYYEKALGDLEPDYAYKVIEEEYDYELDKVSEDEAE